MPDHETERGTWLATGPAAARLGITPDGLRKAIRRGKCPYPARRDNRGTWEVRIPDRLATVPPDSREAVPDTRDSELAALRATIEGLHGQMESLQALVGAQRQHISDLRDRLAAERARIGALERRLDEGHAERTRLFGLLTGERARVDQLLAAPAQRPRWWLWWRRG